LNTNFPYSVARLIWAVTAFSFVFGQNHNDSFALPVLTPDLIALQPQIEAQRFVLRITGPHGVRLISEFNGDSAPFIEPYDLDGMPLPDGTYRFELTAVPQVSPSMRKTMQEARLAGDRNELAALKAEWGILNMPVQSGSFIVQYGGFLTPEAQTSEVPVTDVDDPSEAVFAENLSVQGSLCVGFDCLSNESFEQDTVRLKENTLRIHVDDTSTMMGFPANDWRLTFNDLTSGGADYAAIEDATAGTAPIRVDAGAGNHALYIESGGDVGFGTNSPATELHVVSGDAPTLRLEQDTTGSFVAQTWELSADESNFAVTDVTGSATPLLVEAGAPANSIYIEDSGEVGLGVNNPAAELHVVSGDAPALLLEQDTSASMAARAWALTADESKFSLSDQTEGSTPFLVEARAPTNALVVEDSGEVGLGVSAPDTALHIRGSGGDTQLKIEETEPNNDGVCLLNLINDGPGRIRFENQDNITCWTVANDATGFVIDKARTPGTDLFITNSRRFLIRPNGPSDPGLVLEANGDMEIGGTLTQNSNRHAKKDFEPVDPQATLDKVATLPLSEWTYKDDELGTRHFGPMAQDFADAFGLGKDREHIAVLDMAGVALASIQALDRKNGELRRQLELKGIKLDEKDAQIDALNAENQRIQEALAEQRQRLDKLERLVLGADESPAE